MLQNGQTPKDLAQKAGHMSVVRLLAGPDTYQQNLDSGLGGQVTLHHVSTAYTTLPCRLLILMLVPCQPSKAVEEAVSPV